jgi:peptidoglycan/LPS O-acetylase OafA/YrhL
VDRAALVVALEGLLLVAFAAAYAVEGLRGEALSRPGAELGAALVGGAGVGLLLAARGLHRRRTWARGPAVAVQLVALLTAFSLMSTPLAGPATVAVVVAAVVVYLLFTAEARAELDRRPTQG